MSRLKERIRFIKQVDVIQFLYLNYFCRSVIRSDRSKVIPYRHAVIDLDPSSRIHLSRGDLEIGGDLLKGSKAETFLRLRENSVWISEGGCHFSYGSTFELLGGAKVHSGYMTMNTGSSIVCAAEMELGQDLMIARNVVVYDSDFHPIRNEKGERINPPSRVRIGAHVWIGTGTIILKGSEIGDNCVIAAGSRVSGKVESGSLCRADGTRKQDYGRWER
jgi:acetyltransferase-like isoleucine patch superfamily enzyme